MKKKKKRCIHEDEPSWEDCDDLVEWGEESIFAVDFTSGGSPLGPTLTELRESEELDNYQAGWARAKRIFRRAFIGEEGSARQAEIGRIRKIGEGFDRKAFSAWIEVIDEPERSGGYVALISKPDCDPQSDLNCRREAVLTNRLSQLAPPFRVAKTLALVPEMGRVASVQEAASGVELDLRAGRQYKLKPWEIVAQIAAAIHNLDAAVFHDIFPGHSTRKAFGKSILNVSFKKTARNSILHDAYCWASENLPSEEQVVLVHGDLLGQNILIPLEGSPFVIDWQCTCLGDPAYDLAIVTRGKRRPFQLNNGLELLLSSYQRNGGAAISAKEIHFYELCLAAGWYFDALEHCPSSGRVQEELNRLNSVLRRASE